MKKQIGTTLVKVEGKFYIVTQKKDVYGVNEVGARIYDLCNGINSINDIKEKLLKVFNVNKEILSEDIDKYIEILKENGLIVVE